MLPSHFILTVSHSAEIVTLPTLGSLSVLSVKVSQLGTDIAKLRSSAGTVFLQASSSPTVAVQVAAGFVQDGGWLVWVVWARQDWYPALHASRAA